MPNVTHNREGMVKETSLNHKCSICKSLTAKDLKTHVFVHGVDSSI